MGDNSSDFVSLSLAKTVYEHKMLNAFHSLLGTFHFDFYQVGLGDFYRQNSWHILSEKLKEHDSGRLTVKQLRRQSYYQKEGWISFRKRFPQNLWISHDRSLSPTEKYGVPGSFQDQNHIAAADKWFPDALVSFPVNRVTILIIRVQR